MHLSVYETDVDLLSDEVVEAIAVLDSHLRSSDFKQVQLTFYPHDGSEKPKAVVMVEEPDN